jgi:hypothetical protein
MINNGYRGVFRELFVNRTGLRGAASAASYHGLGGPTGNPGVRMRLIRSVRAHRRAGEVNPAKLGGGISQTGDRVGLKYPVKRI